MDDYGGEERRSAPKGRGGWLPLLATFLATIATNAVMLAYAYGQITARVTTLEVLRVEARNEVQSQLAVIDSKLTRLLERRTP